MLASLIVFGGPATLRAGHLTGTDATYTLDADFDEGTLLNVNHDAPGSDQLNLNLEATPFPFVNIAASGRGTVIRINVDTGEVVGEYLTAPDLMGRNPSRTTVDHFGNVWVGNRNEGSLSNGFVRGSVVRVGLLVGGTRVDEDGTPNLEGEYVAPPFGYNTCLDRDRDGLIRTSRGLLDIRPWPNTDGRDSDGGVSTAQDECILNYTRVRGTNTRAIGVDRNNDIWVGGIGDQSPEGAYWFERIDGDTGEVIPGTSFNLGCGGYGAVIDHDGVLWSAGAWGDGGQLLRYDPAADGGLGAGECLIPVSGPYGMGIDPNTGRIWLTENGTAGVAAGVNELNHDGTLRNRYVIPDWPTSQGMAIDNNSHVWVASCGACANTQIAHFAPVDPANPDGGHVYVGQITDLVWPTGIAVDSNGRIWAPELAGNRVSRIDPLGGAVGGGGYAIGAVDMQISLGLGSDPYNYSDMTGFVSIANPPIGIWTVVHDGGQPGVAWNQIGWNGEPEGSQPEGSTIVVEARAAASQAGLPEEIFAEVPNGTPFDIGRGRYVEIRVTMRAVSADALPVFSDLRIQSLCGNGTQDPGEACDLGAANGTGCACSATCDVASVGTVCSTAEPGECSLPNTCNGLGECVANHLPSGTACGDRGETECDGADTCDGLGVCRDNIAEAGAPCGDQGETECDRPNTCNGDGTCNLNFVEAGIACGDDTDTECDNPDQCDGAGGCGDSLEADGVLCATDGSFCTGAEACLRGACASPGNPCNPATESCDEADNACVPQCGDGVRDDDEACDDGNNESLDGCSATCTAESGWSCSGEIGQDSVCVATCGDGELAEGAEDCEDENSENGDGCSDDCFVEPGWECTLDEETQLSECDTICGDGEVAGAESCDDENTANGDGCSDACLVEEGFVCDSGEPSICGPDIVCGDGDVDAGEDCDDNNAQTGDGCTTACDVEPGFICDDSEPTVCVPDRDHDDVPDVDDNCPSTANPDQADGDTDDIGDVCDPDGDNDDVPDIDDNCPLDANAGQEDLDNDLVGDVCDDDRDGDGIANGDEPALGVSPDDPDSDDDGLNDGDEIGRGTIPTDPDSDDGGVFDGEEVVSGTDPRPGHPEDDYDLTGGGVPSACAQAPPGELGLAGLVIGLLVVWAARRRRSSTR